MGKTVFGRLCMTVAGALLAGCAAIGPVDSPEFSDLAARAVPAENGVARMTGSGVWYPNAKGFTDLRNVFLQKPVDGIPGALILTDNAVLFAQWEEKKSAFEVIKRILVSDLASAEIDEYGAGRRLVLRNKDFSYQSFTFTRASGNLGDSEKTERAVQFLNGKLASSPKDSR